LRLDVDLIILQRIIPFEKVLSKPVRRRHAYTDHGLFQKAFRVTSEVIKRSRHCSLSPIKQPRITATLTIEKAISVCYPNLNQLRFSHVCFESDNKTGIMVRYHAESRWIVQNLHFFCTLISKNPVCLERLESALPPL